MAGQVREIVTPETLPKEQSAGQSFSFLFVRPGNELCLYLPGGGNPSS